MSEQAVIVAITLGGTGFGQSGERALVRRVSEEIGELVLAAGVGENDGDEFGGGRASLYLYGPSADAIYATIEPTLTTLVPGRTTITLRYGEAEDPASEERQVSL